MDKVGLDIVNFIIDKQYTLFHTLMEENVTDNPEPYVYFYSGSYGLPLDGHDVIETIDFIGLYEEKLFQRFNLSTNKNKEIECLPLSEFCHKLRNVILLNKKLI
jgi:hypothetical protein